MRKADAVTPADSALAKAKDCGKLIELATVAEITSAVEEEVCRLIRAGTFDKVVIKTSAAGEHESCWLLSASALSESKDDEPKEIPCAKVSFSEDAIGILYQYANILVTEIQSVLNYKKKPLYKDRRFREDNPDMLGFRLEVHIGVEEVVHSTYCNGIEVIRCELPNRAFGSMNS